MKPTIGIIGGCGPLATIDIEQKILAHTQNLLNPLLDQDYFSMLVFNHTQFTDRNDAFKEGEHTLVKDFINCSQALVSIGIDILLIACQTAHAYIFQIEQETGLKAVDITQETCKIIDLMSPRPLKIGLLATDSTICHQFYQSTLATKGIEVKTPTQDEQVSVMQAIYLIKARPAYSSLACKTSSDLLVNEKRYAKIANHPYRRILLHTPMPDPLLLLNQAIDNLRLQGCQHIILGCTELPLLINSLKKANPDIIFIDSNDIAAFATVKLAISIQENARINQQDFNLSTINYKERSYSCVE